MTIVEEDILHEMKAHGARCPKCGCQLGPYEVFAGRIRGLETPVCIGCLVEALQFLKDFLVPALETSLKMLSQERPQQ